MLLQENMDLQYINHTAPQKSAIYFALQGALTVAQSVLLLICPVKNPNVPNRAVTGLTCLMLLWSMRRKTQTCFWTDNRWLHIWVTSVKLPCEGWLLVFQCCHCENTDPVAVNKGTLGTSLNIDCLFVCGFSDSVCVSHGGHAHQTRGVKETRDLWRAIVLNKQLQLAHRTGSFLFKLKGQADFN